MSNVIYLPPGEGGIKTGLDDFFARGHTVEDLVALATPDLRAPATGTERPCRYLEQNGGLVFQKEVGDDVIPVPLTNFTARINRDIVKNDGVEKQREFELVANCDGRSTRFSVPAAEFPSMQWVGKHLGARALIYIGHSVKDHVRVAIQSLSSDLQETEVNVYTGWAERDDGLDVYLHGGGAIGKESGSDDVSVALGNGLEHFVLPPPPGEENLRTSVLACLHLLELGPPELGFVMLAVVFRAILGRTDFSLFLVGPSGVFKSEVAALIQQFFGAGFNARNLPGSWSSTDNSLEALAFLLKDAVFVIDDFAAHGSMQDVQRLNAKVDRLIRGQGNGAGRGRMNADGTLRPTKRSRCLMVLTGEDKPNGHSLRARSWFIEIAPGEILPARLSVCQQDGSEGVYAGVTAAFCRWLAPRYKNVRDSIPQKINTLRAKTTGRHNRTPEITANLMLGWSLFEDFAVDAGAMSLDTADQLSTEAKAAFLALAARQTAHQAASEPVQRYLELLAAAISSGNAHIADLEGDAPELSTACGWRIETSGSGENMNYHERPRGLKVGWIDGEHLYLSPDAAHQAVKRMGGNSGDGVVLGVTTMNKRLHERGLLQAVEEKRGVLTVRRIIEGRRLNVLHLAASTIIDVETDQSDQREEDAKRDGAKTKQENASNVEKGSASRPPASTLPPTSRIPAEEDPNRPLFEDGAFPLNGRVGRNYKGDEPYLRRM